MANRKILSPERKQKFIAMRNFSKSQRNAFSNNIALLFENALRLDLEKFHIAMNFCLRSRTTISFSNNKIVVVLEQHCVLKILSPNNASRNL